MTPVQREHIELIRQTTGELTPEGVLDDARNPNSPLHECFTWDDGVAAEAFRLIQAKAVVRVAVRFLKQPPRLPQSVRVRMQEPESVSAPPGRDRSAELFAMTVREAEISVLLHALGLEREYLVSVMAQETGPEFATERLAINMFVRGVPMPDIVEVVNASAEAGTTFTENDVGRWTRQFGGTRPLRWSADLARREWDADEGLDHSRVFGLPPFGKRHPRYPDKRTGT
jgi:hypothetical protein